MYELSTNLSLRLCLPYLWRPSMGVFKNVLGMQVFVG